MTNTRAFQPTPAVAPGNRVAVIAPASSFDRASFDAGLALIAARYDVHYRPDIFQRHRYLAGADERRYAELADALLDPTVKAVFCARGGYGATRLLPRLAALPATPPKPLVGFSDISALHLWLQNLGRISIHGPVLTQLPLLPPESLARLFAMLESPAAAAPLYATETYVEGIAEGPLLGGNLSMVTRVLGTPYMPPLDGAILLLEDVGERPYRLDRMWTHLGLAGVFERIRGIALGVFINCEEQDAAYSAAGLLRELAAATGLPCAAGFPIGHGALNDPVALGARVRLDAAAGSLTFLEPAVSRGA
jgi:muramoyltetrapeptide carboxypeptidase